MSGRADIVQRRHATLPIVERFDVKENVGASQRTGFVDCVMPRSIFKLPKKLLAGASS